MSLLLERKSIRNFTDEPVEKEKITALLKAAMQAPSANNQQPWEFIVVDDRAILDELSKASTGAWMLKNVNVAIVTLLIPTEASPHFAVQDMAAATENILLEATNLGLGSVWIGVDPFSMIALGYPKYEKETKIRYQESRIHHNKLEE